MEISVPQSSDHLTYAASRTKGFNGLVDSGVFAIVLQPDADAHLIYNSRFVDNIKHPGTPMALAKSRLVTQPFNDCVKDIMAIATTV